MKIERPWLRIIVAVFVGGVADVAIWIWGRHLVPRARPFGTASRAWWLIFFWSMFLNGPIIATVLAHVLAPKEPKDGHTRCGKCGYILKGLTEPRCSECGERI